MLSAHRCPPGREGNTPEHIEAHFGVPMCGAVLNPLNYRLDVRNITFMLQHAEAKVSEKTEPCRVRASALVRTDTPRLWSSASGDIAGSYHVLYHASLFVVLPMPFTVSCVMV